MIKVCFWQQFKFGDFGCSTCVVCEIFKLSIFEVPQAQSKTSFGNSKLESEFREFKIGERVHAQTCVFCWVQYLKVNLEFEIRCGVFDCPKIFSVQTLLWHANLKLGFVCCLFINDAVLVVSYFHKIFTLPFLSSNYSRLFNICMNIYTCMYMYICTYIWVKPFGFRLNFACYF